MTIYTVHEPPPRRNQSQGDTGRFVFVRDGFHLWAVVFGPLWILVHRLWLVLLCYVIAMALLQGGLWALGVSPGVRWIVGLLVSLLIGFEASSLRRWTYRKWRSHGVVVASDLDTAERRFFNSYVRKQQTPPVEASLAAPIMRVPPASTDVIGLFPEPDLRR
jgi:hypothetical protein